MNQRTSEALENLAATLAEQNESWAAARTALTELGDSVSVSVPPDLLDEIEDACAAPRRTPNHLGILSAYRA